MLYTNNLTSSAEISAQNNFQGLILGGYGIYTDTPPVATALSGTGLQRGQEAERASGERLSGKAPGKRGSGAKPQKPRYINRLFN